MDVTLFNKLKSYLTLNSWVVSINGNSPGREEAPKQGDRFVMNFRLQNNARHPLLGEVPGIVFLRPHIVIDLDLRFARFADDDRRQIALFFEHDRLAPGEDSNVQQGFIAVGELDDFEDITGTEPIAYVFPVADLDYERFFQISAHHAIAVEIEG